MTLPRDVYYTRHTAKAHATVAHRSGVTAVDTGAPTATDTRWAVNPGAQLARFYVDVSFTGGVSPTVTLQPWLRSGNVVGRLASTFTFPAGQHVIDVQAEGDDVLLFVESVGGAPTNFSVSAHIAWR